MRCRHPVFWFFYCVCYVYAVSSNIWHHIELVFTMTVLFGLHSFWTIKPALVNSAILSKMVRRSFPCCFPFFFSGIFVAYYFLPKITNILNTSRLSPQFFQADTGGWENQLINISILESWNILFPFFSYSISQLWNLWTP